MGQYHPDVDDVCPSCEQPAPTGECTNMFCAENPHNIHDMINPDSTSGPLIFHDRRIRAANHRNN